LHYFYLTNYAYVNIPGIIPVRKACDTGIIKQVEESITPNYEQGDEIPGHAGVAS
jgi:hypothetical protein